MKTSGKVWISGRLENPKSKHWHWTKQRKWAASWREVAATLCKSMVDGPPEAPKRITFEAQVWRRFDDDGLRVALSPIRDGLQIPLLKGVIYGQSLGPSRLIPGAGIIHNDGPGSGHEFIYRQVVNRKNPGVWITVDVV